MSTSKVSSDASSRITQCQSFLTELLSEGVKCNVFSRAAAAIFSHDGHVCVATHDIHDNFDLASVTKVVTSVLALKYLDITHPLSTLGGRRTVEEILLHSAGLPAWKPYFALASKHLGVSYSNLLRDPKLQFEANQFVLNDLSRISISGPAPVYSDIGYLALGYEVERVSGKAIAELLTSSIEPYLNYFEGTASWGSPSPQVVDTGFGRPRAGTPFPEFSILRSVGVEPEVHDRKVDDDNAAALGSAVGHAGLVASASWVGRLGYEILQASSGNSLLLSQKQATQMLTEHVSVSRTLGLDVSRGVGSQIGSRLCLGRISGGIQTGFTGGSLCLDPSQGVSIALLSNATVLERPSHRIRLFRPHFHDALANILCVT